MAERTLLDRILRRTAAVPEVPESLVYDPPPTSIVAAQRAAFLPNMSITPSRWAGWPTDWLDPTWDGASRLNTLVDTAWACLDLNSSVLASMPPYLTKGGVVIPSKAWMGNPDPSKYVSWDDFAKEAFWEYQQGELFLLCMARDFSGYPVQFRVIPAAFVDIVDGSFRIGSFQVPDGDMLHIKYSRQPGSAHGVGPLDAAGARLTSAATIARHTAGLIEKGLVPPYHLETDKPLTKDQANATLDTWNEGRAARPGEPGFLSGGAKIVESQGKSAKEMMLVEVSQFTESRIAILFGVPPFLVGLPSGGDSMTYSNVSQLFDFHERSSLGPKASAVMAAVSAWALPRGTQIDINRDAYTRPDAATRATYYKTLWEMNAISPDEVRTIERMNGDIAPLALTGMEE